MLVPPYNREAGLSVKVEGGGLNGEAQPRFAHTAPLRKERAAGVVPAFTLLQKNKKSQVHFAKASNTRSRQDRSESTKQRAQSILSDRVCLWFQHRSCMCLSGEKS